MLSKDRKRILLSVLLGALIISGSYGLLMIEFWIPQIIGGLGIILTYIIFQFAMSYGRDLIDKEGNIYNADGIDVTNKVPKHMHWQNTFFIFSIWPINSSVIKCHVYLMDTYPNHSKFFEISKDIWVIFMPYLIIHLYYFCKGLPVSTLLRFAQGGGTSNTTNRTYQVENRTYSSNDRFYNPTQSSYGGNIFHSTKR